MNGYTKTQLLDQINTSSENMAQFYNASFVNYQGKKSDTREYYTEIIAAWCLTFLRSGETITVGDIRITPFLCDHSAFDSYMLLLECEGKRILYTGDFRANGRKSFSALLSRLGHADVLITEGTTLSRENKTNITETELEMIVGSAMSKTQGPAFIFMASTNIDRCVSAYKAARRAGRIFMQDVYTASIVSAAGDNIPNPGTFRNVRVFLTSPAEKQRGILERFPMTKIGRAGNAFAFLYQSYLPIPLLYPGTQFLNLTVLLLQHPTEFC